MAVITSSVLRNVSPNVLRMRVMFFFAGGHYGAFYTARDYLTAAAERSLDCLVATGERGSVWSVAKELGLPVRVLPIYGHSYDLRRMIQLVRGIRLARPDVIHSHLAFPSSVMVGLAAAVTGTPWVDHAGMEFVVWHRTRSIARYQRWALRFVSTRRGLTVAMSDRVKATLVAAGVPADRIRVVHHGVDADAIQRAKDYVLPPELDEAIAGRRVIACVGHLSRDKRQVDLIDAFAKVLGDFPEALLLLIGSDHMTYYAPGYERLLRQRVSDKGVNRGVHFAGHLQRELVWAALHRCVALAHPSEKEGFGIAVPEAMAASIPVVVSDTGALPEIVREGTDGFVVPVGGIEEMAESIAWILDNADAAAAMGDAARERARAQFSLAESIDRVFSVYETLSRETGK